MISCKQLRKYIIAPILNKLKLYSAEAEELLIFTCATESHGGSFIVQVGGPALGIYQMEPKTYYNLYEHTIKGNSHLCYLLGLHFGFSSLPTEDRLIYDLYYATAMTRIFYFAISEALPSANNTDLIWEYYKKYYNTYLGKAVKEKAIEDYQKFIVT